MGFSTYQWLNKHPTMKSFAFVLLIAAAVAEPEAKADPEAGYLYGGYGGYGLGYVGYARGYGLGGYYGGYGGYGLGLGYRSYGYGLRHFGKRSADAEPAAEPEAEPGYLYGGYGGYGLGYGGYYGRGYGGYGLGLGYRSYGYGHGLRSYGYAGHYLGKRSADAEPEADAGNVWRIWSWLWWLWIRTWIRIRSWWIQRLRLWSVGKINILPIFLLELSSRNCQLLITCLRTSHPLIRNQYLTFVESRI